MDEGKNFLHNYQNSVSEPTLNLPLGNQATQTSTSVSVIPVHSISSSEDAAQPEAATRHEQQQGPISDGTGLMRER